MSNFILDLFFVLIFVLFLILLFRIKDKAFTENKECYRYTVSGIFVLLAVSILRLLDHQNLFDTVPFFSEAIYRNLMEAIGIVAGAALLVAGVTLWLPARKTNGLAMRKRLGKFSSIEKIEREIIDGKNIERLFETIPEMICYSFGFVSAAVFRLHHRNNRVICTNYVNPEEELSSLLGGFQLTVVPDNDSFIKIKKEINADHYIILNINGTANAAIYFWNAKDIEISNSDYVMIDKIGQLFSGKLTEFWRINKLKFYENNWLYLRHVKRIVAKRCDIEEKIRDLHLLMKGAIDSEFMSLAIMDKYPWNFKRFTSGIDKRVLLEDGTCPPVQGTQIETVLLTHKSLLIDDVTSIPSNTIESLFLSCNQKCMIAVPIQSHGHIIGVLTLGHPQNGRFDRLDLKRVEMIAAFITPILETDTTRRRLHEKDRYLGALFAFNSAMEEGDDIDALYESAAELIFENVGTTMVRVSAYNQKNITLSTIALKSSRPLKYINWDSVRVTEEMTPWHDLVIREKRLLLINQKDPDSSMNINEAKGLVFEGLKSALIIPIVVNNVTFGIITLGEMRDWERYSYDPSAILFCREIAARIAAGIKIYQLSAALSKVGLVERNLPENVFTRQEIIQELKSPVTSLRGSLDLLKLKEFGGSRISRRILNSLEESTNKIVSVITEDEPTSR